MKQKYRTIINASAAAFLVVSSFAQDTPKPKTTRPGPAREQVAQARRAGQLNGAAKSSELLGMTVNNYQGEKLGKVEEIAVDVESGRVVQVIVSTGGFIGMGDTLTPVPPGALHHDVTNKLLHLNADREKLKNAPRFELSNWAGASDTGYLSSVYHYFGEAPAFDFVREEPVNREGQRNPDGSPNPVTTRKPDGISVPDRLSTDSPTLIPTARLTQVQRVSKLIGTSVKNLQEEKLGKVDNILVDLASGHVVAVIISSGGFLGLGDELSAVPPTALRFTSERKVLQLDASKAMLSSAPHFKANQWPDFAQTGYAGDVYRAYRIEPYFTPTAATEVDNTARNSKDREGRTVTPFDQGNSPADLDITSKIRLEIVARKNLSVYAKNVKIITKNGQVTLRGPVKTAEEKQLIGEIAERIAHSQNVDNQLEVKLTTSANN